MNDDPLAISREDLYELVWSKPMVELAADVGLSDVALAKRCRKLGIPVPGRGYWARVAAGQRPRQMALPKREDEPTDYSALTFGTPEEPERAGTARPESSPIDTQVQALEILPTSNVNDALSSVRRSALRIGHASAKALGLTPKERSGPIVQISVSAEQALRALRIVDTTLRAAESLGWKLEAPPPADDDGPHNRYAPPEPEPTPVGLLRVDGETMKIRIDERNRRSEHVLTEDEKLRKRRSEYLYVPRWDYAPSGELRLHIESAEHSYGVKTFKDSVRVRLEEQTRNIVLALHAHALELKARREQKRLDEIERKRQEGLRWQRHERRAAELKLAAALELQAGAWWRARMLRHYVRTVQRVLESKRIEVRTKDNRIDFFQWAQEYIDQLDPLHEAPRNPDLERDEYSYSGSSNFQDEVQRLTGHKWSDSWKLLNEKSHGGDDDDDHAG